MVTTEAAGEVVSMDRGAEREAGEAGSGGGRQLGIVGRVWQVSAGLANERPAPGQGRAKHQGAEGHGGWGCAEQQ